MLTRPLDACRAVVARPRRCAAERTRRKRPHPHSPAARIDLQACGKLEPSHIASEVRTYRALGETVVTQGLGDTAAIRAALVEVDHAHASSGAVAAHDLKAYALASEILCLAIDATHSRTGLGADATAAALALREKNQAQIVGDFVVAGR